MKVIKKVESMAKITKDRVLKNNTIGFIPTMGALHEGHLSLIQKAREENDIVIVSIFVNPKQFSNAQDLKKYPRDIEKDGSFVGSFVDYLFVPTEHEMYPSDFHTSITVGDHAHDLEGKFRPGHFEGMATVVHKLINICMPTRTYLGLKDYQQFIVVSQMVKDLNMNTKIIGVKTIREASGLAMSSRNTQLSREEQVTSTLIYATLRKAKKLIQNNIRNPHVIEQFVTSELVKLPKSKIEYVAVRTLKLEKTQNIESDIVLLVALHVGNVRLIDNIIVCNKNHSPITSGDLQLIL